MGNPDGNIIDHFEDQAEEPPVDVECTPGWESRCQQSKSSECHCKCGGVNHGKKAVWRKAKVST